MLPEVSSMNRMFGRTSTSGISSISSVSSARAGGMPAPRASSNPAPRCVILRVLVLISLSFATAPDVTSEPDANGLDRVGFQVMQHRGRDLRRLAHVLDLLAEFLEAEPLVVGFVLRRRGHANRVVLALPAFPERHRAVRRAGEAQLGERKSTRLNSSHVKISY